MGRDFEELAGGTPDSGSISTSRTGFRSSVIWYKPGRASGPGDSGAGSAWRSAPQNGQGGEVIVSPHRKIVVPRIKVIKVSLPWYLTYWISLILIVLGVGFKWGF